ncbi:UNVERIFIED_CONTAM: hypothetical protein HDU68_005250 [Siphonaria sp. JEL0065]|nr:hypothetical protein HDU68_005250 [Siphonaria sp. JEL0065]
MAAIAKQISDELSTFGLDICTPFQADFYNDEVLEGDNPPLPLLAPTGPTLSILVANNKNLWTHFKKHLKENPSALESRDPLDDYVRGVIDLALEKIVDPNIPADVRFAFDRGQKFVAFQKLAHMIGESFYNRQVFLCSHPVYGPWQALRAVITIGVDASDIPYSHAEVQDPYPEGAPRVVECMNQYFEAVKGDGGPKESAPQHIYRYLVAARDAATIPNQVQYRYFEDQIAYHYTKKKEVLRNGFE